MHVIKSRWLSPQILSFFFAGFNIKENQVFNEKDNRSQIVFIAEKELGDVHIDLIGILEDLPKLSLREMCPNTEFFLSESGKIRTRKTPYLDIFHAVFTLHSSMRNVGILKQSIDESISSISTWNIMNQVR